MSGPFLLQVSRGLPHATEAIAWNPEAGLALPDAAAIRIEAGDLIDGLDDSEVTFALLECRRALCESGVLSVRCAAPVPPRFDFSIGADLRRRGPRGVEATARLARRAGLEPVGSGIPPADEAGARTVSFVRPARALDPEPLVSVVVPAYSPRFFPRALETAVIQTYPNLEIVVCDDSPGGEIESAARSAGSKRPVRYLRNPPPPGARANYNRCLREARGTLVKFLNDDDELDPRAVERMAGALVARPGAVLAFSPRTRIDASGTTLDDVPATVPVAGQDLEIRGWTLASAMLTSGLNFIGEPTTVMFRRDDALRDASGGDAFHFEGESGRGVIDMVIFTRLLLTGDAVFLAERLSRFRIHEGQAQQMAEVVDMGGRSLQALQDAWMSIGLDRRVALGDVLVRPLAAPHEPFRRLAVEAIARLHGRRAS